VPRLLSKRLSIKSYQSKAAEPVFELDRRHLARNFKSASGGGMM
jgi:hypothetical protein